MIVGIVTIVLFNPTFCDLSGQERDASNGVESRRQVILLTGFQPFGPDKSANPSWEGIKALDGVKWKEFELVAKEMPAVWGAPLESLSKWIAEYRPVAVLSFGQGGADGFRVETVANNRRGRALDNNGSQPTSPDIIAKGPSRLPATIDANRLARALTSAGFPTRVSKEAGKYLCEETLYTLEYLRQNSKDDLSVMFCHVPPIGTMVGSNQVDGLYVQKFVTRVLEEWRSIATESKADLAAAEAHIRKYFKVWSDQDMQGYGNCFSRHASIHSIDAGGNMSLSSLKPFVEGQTRAHKSSLSKMVEVPEEIVMRSEGRLVRAIVRWKLTADNRITTGYDHFTLGKEGGQWKIINLVFYESE